MYRNTHATVGQNPGCAGLRIVDCGLRINRSPIRNPKSEIRNRLPFRPGISLTEVLIAMGILTVGLLGVAAIFPVGSYYMQKGDVADRGSAIAQSAFNDAISRGTLNPSNWLAWEDGSVFPSAALPAIPLEPRSTGFTFTRPFAERLRRQKAAQASSVATAADKAKYTSLEFGSVFLIDPMGVASVAQINNIGVPIPSGNSGNMRPGGVFPASNVLSLPQYPTVPEWKSWGDDINQGPRWPIRRVTLRQPNISGNNKPLDTVLADRQFSTHDDLALDLPPAQDKPSIQRWQLGNLDGGSVADDPLTRQSRGDYSWYISVSPTTAEARDALATNSSAQSYEVSVVVLYKRPIAVTSPIEDADVLANRGYLIQNERGVSAKIVSSGLSGGEVLLTRIPPAASFGSVEPEESPFNILKTGNWVMVCGPHPNSTDERPMMTARWYRVLSIEGKDRRLNSEGEYDPPPPATDQERRLVSLRGPQWPWQPATTATGALDLNDTANISNALYVCIPAGAVAVHSKTIHLEGNSAWSGGAEGISVPPPPGPRWTTGG